MIDTMMTIVAECCKKVTIITMMGVTMVIKADDRRDRGPSVSA